MIAAGLLAGDGPVSVVLSVVARRFPAGDGSAGARVDVRQVRRFVRGVLGEVLDGAGVDLDDVEVMASEVATNAVLYTASGRPGGRLWAAVIATDDVVRVEITDQGGAHSEPRIPAYAGLGGRGLLLVQELSARWDWCRNSAGRTTVWFEVPRAGGAVGCRGGGRGE